MPLYSFTCLTCGDFTEMRRMALADAPVQCPLCGHPARRVLTVPHVARINPAVRRAHELNEKSAHEPRVVRGEDWRRERAWGVPHSSGRHSHGRPR